MTGMPTINMEVMLLSSGILKFHADFWIVISNNIFQAYESDPTAVSPSTGGFPAVAKLQPAATGACWVL